MRLVARSLVMLGWQDAVSRAYLFRRWVTAREELIGDCVGVACRWSSAGARDGEVRSTDSIRIGYGVVLCVFHCI